MKVRGGIRILFTCIMMVFVAGTPVRGEEGSIYLEAIEKGREIFHERCAVCHGFDGVPEIPEAPNFARGERLDKSDEELLNTIKHGQAMMPAWKDKLTEEEMREVLTYARIIMGDVVFQERCIHCHSTRVPPLSESLPAVEELSGYSGPLDICRSCNIEREMTREEIISVIRFIRTLAD